MPETKRYCHCNLRTRVSSYTQDLCDRFYSRNLTFVSRDSTSQHVLQADEAIGLGAIGQEGGNPYLNIEKLVNVAQSAQADAIHPGYGYLSENASFADAVRQAGLAFIGPSSNAMSTLGDKRSAKAYLREHDPSIPLIPGVASSSQQPDELAKSAADIGYPVMLKASAGGGGKGMRIVRSASDFDAELQRAQSEAARFFGSSDCIVEKYIESGKHIEVQIMGDQYGNVISLNERECSVQRRHQKVIEETPSPWLDAAKRQDMCQAAVAIGKLLEYENAGTVEFVFDVDTGKFYFLEVNTRLQVEHPITEETTRLDLVALQLFVAAGGDLSTLKELRSVQQIGHAIECRLCAEDPSRDFYPENGTIRLWKPAGLSDKDSQHVRFETGVTTGSQVSIYFDSMIAKIVVWAPTRALARAKMIRVLADTACVGVGTNQLFLQSCLSNNAFSNPGYTTSFIPQNLSALHISPYAPSAAALKSSLPLLVSYAIAALPQYLPPATHRKAFSKIRPKFRNQSFDSANSAQRRTILTYNDASAGESPALLCSWATQQAGSVSCDGFTAPLPEAKVPAGKTAGVAARYNALSNALKLKTMPGQREHSISIIACDATIAHNESASWILASMNICLDGVTFKLELATEQSNLTPSSVTDVASGIRVMVHVPRLGTWVGFNVFSVLSYFESLREALGEGQEGKLKVVNAPMPCKVLSVLKKDGAQVKAGEKLMIVESMKMEISISAQTDGIFRAKVQELDAVDEGTALCVVE
jgi:acetyl/propionyl-CoA carboxylase alpha subunit